MKTREIIQHINTAGKLVFSSPKKAYLDGEKYRLTSKGVLFARIFIFYRKLLNAPKGGWVVLGYIVKD